MGKRTCAQILMGTYNQEKQNDSSVSMAADFLEANGSQDKQNDGNVSKDFLHLCEVTLLNLFLGVLIVLFCKTTFNREQNKKTENVVDKEEVTPSTNDTDEVTPLITDTEFK